MASWRCDDGGGVTLWRCDDGGGVTLWRCDDGGDVALWRCDDGGGVSWRGTCFTGYDGGEVLTLWESDIADDERLSGSTRITDDECGGVEWAGNGNLE